MLEPIAISNRPSQLSPDVETYRAVVPGTATLSDSLVIGISSPYRKTGLLHQKFKAHYGRDGDVLVTRRPSAVFRLARTDSGLLVSFARSRFSGSTAAAPLPKRSIFMGLRYSGPVPDLRSVAEADWSAEHFPS